MARYKVQAPDGSIIELDGPDNATDAQLIQAAQAAYAQRQQGAQAQAAAPVPAAAPAAAPVAAPAAMAPAAAPRAARPAPAAMATPAPVVAPAPAAPATAPAPAAAAGQPRPMGFFEGLVESVTGRARATPETQRLPEWTTMPELNQMSVASFKTALGSLLSNPQETVQILQANFPNVMIRQDEKGNYILRSSVNQEEYAIPPGLTMGDLPRILGGFAAFTPAGRAATIPGAALKAGATQAGIEATQTGIPPHSFLGDALSVGGEFNLGEVGLATVTGPAGQIIQRVAPPAAAAVRRGVQRATGRAPAAPPTPAAPRVEPTFDMGPPTGAPAAQLQALEFELEMLSSQPIRQGESRVIREARVGEVQEQIAALRSRPATAPPAPAAAPPVAPAAPPVTPPVAGARLAPEPTAKQLPSDIESARQAGITLMTSDVVPPRTFASKWLQTIGERIPGAGTGGIRQTQQTERIDAVRNVLLDFGADDAARASDDVMKDLATKRGADLAKYSGAKTEVIERLGQTGTVPMTNTVKAIDDEIAKLQGLKTQEVAPIIERLTDWKAALQDQNLINVEALRKQIGESFKAPELASVRGIGEKALSNIYKPLKQDMQSFITQVGERRDVTKWKVADKRLSDLAGELDMSTLKSVLRRGDETPEVVANMLFSKKPSEVRQLYASLTPTGRERARAAILSRAAEKATENVAEGTVVSPDKFANEVKRLGTSVGVFFNGDDLKQVEGLVRVLNITKRASAAAAAPPTGVQAAIPVSAAALSSFFGGGLPGFIATLGAAGGVGVAARIYESAPVRNLLMKIPQTVAGSKEEAALLKSLTSAIQTGRQFDQENQQ